MTKCPCGCKGTIKPGNRYATSGCASRARGLIRRKGQPVKPKHGGFVDNNSIFAKPKGQGLPTHTWWAGVSREQWMATVHEEAKRMAKSDRARQSQGKTGVSVGA